MEGPTAVIPVVPEPPPVFVDPSGRRQRRLRRLAYCAGAVGLIYTLLVGVSFAGGPISPSTVVPFVDETTEQREPSPTPSAPPTPAATSIAPAPPVVSRTAPTGPPAISDTPANTARPTPLPSARPTRATPTVPRPTAPPPTTAPPTAAPTSTEPTTDVPPPVVDPPGGAPAPVEPADE
ncbi:hypothetical protein [Micromonospora sp. DT31]|uniref:hypothetical protein n=1 Tax=Micromonospora sp. DT31 TaxID=3393434 RepID=UPI003CEEB291